MAATLPISAQDALRTLRKMHGALITAVLMYVYTLHVIPAPVPQRIGAPLLATLAVLSASVIAFGIIIRKKKIEPAHETLRRIPDDLAALGQWRIGAMISAAFAESIGLFGLVIYLLGGTTKQAAPFFAVSLIVMLVWWPRKP